MKKRIFKGACVALVTPMNQDGTVNYNKLKELIDFQIENGTDAVLVCGTTGESPTLSYEEYLKVIETSVEHVNAKIPVIAGTGSNNTETAVNHSKEAEDLGADGVLVMTPYYNKASQTGLIRHYNKIADAIDIPLLIYDIPSRTGCKIAIETFYELSKHKNIVGVKEAGADISFAASVKALCGDELALYSGNDDQITPFLSIGGDGVISVLSNILPKETHDICDLYFKGEAKEATYLQLKYLDLIHALFIDVNPIAVKEAMNLTGINAGPCRLPLCELDKEKHEALKSCLTKYNLI